MMKNKSIRWITHNNEKYN